MFQQAFSPQPDLAQMICVLLSVEFGRLCPHPLPFPFALPTGSLLPVGLLLRKELSLDSRYVGRGKELGLE